MVIYPGDRLTLTRDLETELLIVHLGTPPAVVELNGFTLRYDEREFHGSGGFEIRSQGRAIELHESFADVGAYFLAFPPR
jgi:hypothetical protein